MTIKERYRDLIEDAIGKARFSRSRAAVTGEDGAEAYAVPQAAWLHRLGRERG